MNEIILSPSDSQAPDLEKNKGLVFVFLMLSDLIQKTDLLSTSSLFKIHFNITVVQEQPPVQELIPAHKLAHMSHRPPTSQGQEKL